MKTQRTIKVSDAAHALAVKLSERENISMSKLVLRLLEDEESGTAAAGMKVDLRDLRILIESVKTTIELKEMLNTTIITGQIDWDDPLPSPSMTPQERAEYLRGQIKRRLLKQRRAKV